MRVLNNIWEIWWRFHENCNEYQKNFDAISETLRVNTQFKVPHSELSTLGRLNVIIINVRVCN